VQAGDICRVDQISYKPARVVFRHELIDGALILIVLQGKVGTYSTLGMKPICPQAASCRACRRDVLLENAPIFILASVGPLLAAVMKAVLDPIFGPQFSLSSVLLTV
jgi:hypothetical protein